MKNSTGTLTGRKGVKLMHTGKFIFNTRKVRETTISVPAFFLNFFVSTKMGDKLW